MHRTAYISFDNMKNSSQSTLKNLVTHALLIAQPLSTAHPNLLSSNTHACQPPGIMSHGLEMWTTTDDISLDNMKEFTAHGKEFGDMWMGHP